MEKLEALASVTRISKNVVRVLGQNPGKFTLQGTNTYIIGKQNPYTLVDTGEGREEYIPILESAFQDAARPSNPDEPDVSDIIISHWHHDHVGGLPAVLSLLRSLWERRRPSTPYRPPRLHKYPLPEGAETISHSSRNPLPSIIKSLRPDLYSPAPSGGPFHDLHDAQVLSTSLDIRVLHTPGHTLDSICLHIPDDRALYTADTVIGQGTAVFEDLAAYITSLQKMLRFANLSDSETPTPMAVYPGHGPVIDDGPAVIGMYIKHRLEREEQILVLLRSTPPPSSSLWTTWSLVSRIYAAYPESLWLPAAHGINLHLEKLEGEHTIVRVAGEGQDTSWKLLSKL
ncbi:lactamase [Infundibulicybe gibba]|nr:lactamase [Infundibulicybe gibba]